MQWCPIFRRPVVDINRVQVGSVGVKQLDNTARRNVANHLYNIRVVSVMTDNKRDILDVGLLDQRSQHMLKILGSVVRQHKNHQRVSNAVLTIKLVYTIDHVLVFWNGNAELDRRARRARCNFFVSGRIDYVSRSINGLRWHRTSMHQLLI